MYSWQDLYIHNSNDNLCCVFAFYGIINNVVCAAVWDLAQIRFAWSNFVPCNRTVSSSNPLYPNLYFKDEHNNAIFDEFDEAFEHIFSLLGYISGLNVAYLPAVTFRHIGEVSAYILNNFTRPWEGE